MVHSTLKCIYWYVSLQYRRHIRISAKDCVGACFSKSMFQPVCYYSICVHHIFLVLPLAFTASFLFLIFFTETNVDDFIIVVIFGLQKNKSVNDIVILIIKNICHLARTCYVVHVCLCSCTKYTAEFNK